MKLYIVRHGAPDYDLDCLTPEGHKQARLAAEHLKNFKIDRVYSSPLGRAKQTCSYYCDLVNKSFEILPFAKELEWGNFKGDPYADGNPWDSSEQLMYEQHRIPSFDDWKKDPLFANDRVVSDVEMRIEEINKFLAKEGYVYDRGAFKVERNNEDSIALFCHGGFTCALFGHLMNIPFPVSCTHFLFELTSITLIEFEKAEIGSYTLPKCVFQNDYSHLKQGI